MKYTLATDTIKRGSFADPKPNTWIRWGGVVPMVFMKCCRKWRALRGELWGETITIAPNGTVSPEIHCRHCSTPSTIYVLEDWMHIRKYGG